MYYMYIKIQSPAKWQWVLSLIISIELTFSTNLRQVFLVFGLFDLMAKGVWDWDWEWEFGSHEKCFFEGLFTYMCRAHLLILRLFTSHDVCVCECHRTHFESILSSICPSNNQSERANTYTVWTIAYLSAGRLPIPLCLRFLQSIAKREFRMKMD